MMNGDKSVSLTTRPTITPAFDWLRLGLAHAARKIAKGPSIFQPLPEPELEHEPVMLRCRPALFEPDHLSRVTACGFNKTLESQVRVLSETEYAERPMQIYRLGAATVLGGAIVAHQQRYWFRNLRPGLRDILSASSAISSHVMANSLPGLRYFGHWLRDDCSAFEAYRDHPGLFSMPRPDWRDATVYGALFDQNWRETPVLHSRDLTVLRDLGFSRAKSARHRALRERLRNHCAQPAPQGKVVFIRRGPSAHAREIANWPDLERRLINAGVEIITPEAGSSDLMTQIVDATLIITVEGSQAAHSLFALREGGALLVLQPPDRFYAAPQEWMRSLDMHCGIVIGTARAEGFDIDPDEVISMADRLMARVERRTEI